MAARNSLLLASVCAASVLLACTSDDVDRPAEQPVSLRDPADVPVQGLDSSELVDFQEGDALFGTPLRDADGLGPVYIRTSCAACHTGGARGPGFVTKFGAVDANGEPLAQSPLLAWGHTERPFVAGPGKTPLLAPNDTSIRTSLRFGPAVFGLGYVEAVRDDEILRIESEQAASAGSVKGVANRVSYGSEDNADTRFHAYKKGDAAIGRFGFKARIATLDDFTADALQGDMGITSPLRPNELPNPDGLTDDNKPGVDFSMRSVRLRANYMRMIAIPRRVQDARGASLFVSTGCAMCHVPSMGVRSDYPYESIRAAGAPIYSDLLLHDMGEGLSDHLPQGVDGRATARQWRTAPLMGLRYNKTYLHDGRARSVEEAVLAHESTGSQANDAVKKFQSLTSEAHQALLHFVEGL